MKKRGIYFLLSFILLLVATRVTVKAERANEEQDLGIHPDGEVQVSVGNLSYASYVEFTHVVNGKTLYYHINFFYDKGVSFRVTSPMGTWSEQHGWFQIPAPAVDTVTLPPQGSGADHSSVSDYEMDYICPKDAKSIRYRDIADGKIYTLSRSFVQSRLSYNCGIRGSLNCSGYAHTKNNDEIYAVTCVFGNLGPGYWGNSQNLVDMPTVGEFVPEQKGFLSIPTITASSTTGIPVKKSVAIGCRYSFPHSFPPIVKAPPLTIETQDKLLGADYTSGVTGTWGHTTTNLIPPLGTILRPDIAPDAEDEFFSGADTTGVVHNIGIKNVPIRVIDSSGSADPSADTTDTQRKVTATTAEAPVIRAEIRAGAVNPQGGTADVTAPYSDVGGNPGGGVEGWTNYPITLICDGSAITGDYNLWSVWASPANGDTFPGTSLDKSTTVNGTAGEATSTTTVFKETAAATGGWKVKGFCADKSDKSNLLSSESSAMELKYDPAAPMAGLSFHPETKTFSDTSTDGLSGVNPAVTGILFRAVGGPAPSEQDSDWQLLSNYTIPVTAANYDVYAKAYDRAGNYDIKLAGRNLKVNGGVEAAIDTDRGATVHAVGCPNPGSPTKVPGSCLAGCHDATTLALTEGSAFHYVYTLHDTDATVGASGTFVNYLPLGVVPMGSVFTDITSTSANATVTGTVAASPEPLGAHAGQF